MDTYREMCEKIYVELNQSKEENQSIKLELDKAKQWGYQLADQITLMNLENREAKALIKNLVNTLERIGIYSDLGGKFAGDALESNRDLILKFL